MCGFRIIQWTGARKILRSMIKKKKKGCIASKRGSRNTDINYSEGSKNHER